MQGVDLEEISKGTGCVWYAFLFWLSAHISYFKWARMLRGNTNPLVSSFDILITPLVFSKRAPCR